MFACEGEMGNKMHTGFHSKKNAYNPILVVGLWHKIVNSRLWHKNLIQFIFLTNKNSTKLILNNHLSVK